MAEPNDELELQIEIEADDDGLKGPDGAPLAAKPDADDKGEKPDKVEKPEIDGDPEAAIAELSAQRDALESRAKTAERSAQTVRADSQRQLAEANLTALTNALAAADADIAEQKRAWKVSQETGDYDKAADAQEKLADKVAERRDLVRHRDAVDQYLKAPVREEPTDPVEALIGRAAQAGAAFSSRAQDWLRSHPEVASDDELFAHVTWADKAAKKRGIKVDSDEYYDFVNEQLGFAQPAAKPAKAAEKAPVEAERPKPRIVARKSVAAPPSRDVPTSNGNLSGTAVKLTSGEARAATDGTHIWNYDDPSGKNKFKKGDPIGIQEFARRKLLLTNDGVYDRMATQQ